MSSAKKLSEIIDNVCSGLSCKDFNPALPPDQLIEKLTSSIREYPPYWGKAHPIIVGDPDENCFILQAIPAEVAKDRWGNVTPQPQGFLIKFLVDEKQVKIKVFSYFIGNNVQMKRNNEIEECKKEFDRKDLFVDCEPLITGFYEAMCKIIERAYPEDRVES